MKIVIPGGTGQVGALLARAFVRDGHDVTVLSRRPASAPWRVATYEPRMIGPWTNELEGADVLIHLAGRNVNCRYTPENRREIFDSRVETTKIIGNAISRCKRPPAVWLQASTATIYSHRFDAPNDDVTGVIGGREADAPQSWRFSVEVATAWERSATDTVTSATRLVLMRSAMVMSPDRGGIFDTLRGLARFGLAGAVDGGRQYMSWIHERDFVRALYWLIEHPELGGAVNVSSPNPLPYRAFMRDLRRAIHMPIGLPATKWMLELGTRVLKTESELVLKSRRVTPRRLLESGFRFDFPEWPAAVKDLVSR